MQYRLFEKLDWKVSALGFGCMRLPTTDRNPMSGNIDEKKSIRMIRYAIDQGVNYVDTAYPYHNGNSEIVTGKALGDGYRQKVKLATKSPLWLIQKPEDFDTYLDEQLKKLSTDHIDFYLLHGLSAQRWENVILKFDLLRRAEGAVEDGRISYLGFSFHDNYGSFKKIIDGYGGWIFCLIKYNYLDTKNQAGTRGLKYAASKGLAVEVMEPLLGGRLANPPQPIKDFFDGFGKKISPAEWALRWIWNQPEVAVVLSGMNSIEQVKANILWANKAKINSLGAEELRLIDRVRKKYRGFVPIPCTKCGYCLPCPNGVNIPAIFELYSDGYVHKDMRTARLLYTRFVGERERAGACQACRACEEKCPQKIAISEWMSKVHAALGEGKP